MKIKVYWCITETREGDYYEDEHGNELQCSPDVTRRISVEERDTSEIKDIFEEQDGDWDFTNSIHLITDTKGEILFNPKCKIAHITDNYDLWHKWDKEKDPFRKSEYSKELIEGTQERQRCYGLDRDRREEDFLERCKYLKEGDEL